MKAAGQRTDDWARPWLEAEASDAFTDAITAVSWAPSGDALAAASLGGEVRIVTGGGHEAPAPASSPIALHPGGALCLAWSHDSAWVASGGTDARLVVRHRRMGTGMEVELAGWVRSVAWSRDGWLAAAAGREVNVAHLDDGRWHTLAPHPGSVTALAWSDHSSPGVPSRLAVAGVGGLRWYQPSRDGEPVASRWEAAALLTMVVDAAAGTVAAGSLRGRVWVSGDGPGPCARAHGRLGPVRRLAWCRGASRLAGAEESRIAVWDHRRRRAAQPSRLQDAIAHPSAFVSLPAHPGGVSDVAWDPGGEILASVGADGHVAVWKPDETRDPLQRIDLGEPLSCLAWRPDGTGLAAGGEAGSLHRLTLRHRPPSSPPP